MEGPLLPLMEGHQRQKRWVEEGGPGAFIVIASTLQWHGERKKMRELWARPTLSDGVKKK